MFGCSMSYDENKKDLCQIFVLYIAYILMFGCLRKFDLCAILRSAMQ